VGGGGVPARAASTRSRAELGRLVVVELPVDHHDRGVVAGGVALDVLEADHAVVGRLVVADAEVLLELVQDRVPPSTAHSVLVQMPTWYSPAGRRRYIV
jgi:hypothetical protein